jgi:hypothetical protein
VVDDGELRARYGVAGLAGFWLVALETLEGGRSAFSIQVVGEAMAAGLSLVLHKDVVAPARRQVSVVRLDEHLRGDGTSLVEVLRAVHGRDVVVPPGQMSWRSRWLAQVRRYDGIPDSEFDGVVARADEVLVSVLGGRGWPEVDVVVRKVAERALGLAGGAHQG